MEQLICTQSLSLVWLLTGRNSDLIRGESRIPTDFHWDRISLSTSAGTADLVLHQGFFFCQESYKQGKKHFHSQVFIICVGLPSSYQGVYLKLFSFEKHATSPSQPLNCCKRSKGFIQAEQTDLIPAEILVPLEGLAKCEFGLVAAWSRDLHAGFTQKYQAGEDAQEDVYLSEIVLEFLIWTTWIWQGCSTLPWDAPQKQLTVS